MQRPCRFLHRKHSCARLAAWVAALALLFVHPLRADDERLAVPPVDELEILDPRVDPLGKPRVIPRPTHDGYEVEIPPSVIVHKYYYTGDRRFRAPFLPGGPTIVVVSHPRTGERCYVELQMLPGAPLVTYRRNRITYDFGTQRIILTFGHCGPPKVILKEGEDDSEDLSDRAREAGLAAAGWLERSGLPHAVHHVAEGTKNAVHTSADLLHDAGQMVVAPVIAAYEATPLSGLLERPVTDRAARARDVAVKRAAREQERLNVTIGTLR